MNGIFPTSGPFSFSPRNGEIILKAKAGDLTKVGTGFSPRNGEIILKYGTNGYDIRKHVSVPAMGR